MKIVIDHVRGSRRGQRQEFVGDERVAIGRHPSCQVSFDAHRDLDSSSRHAEIRRKGAGYVLCDIGSSNGTFIAGERVAEVPLEPGATALVEFGAGGPVLRIWVGAVDGSPEPSAARVRLTRSWLVAAGVAVLMAVAAAVILAL